VTVTVAINEASTAVSGAVQMLIDGGPTPRGGTGALVGHVAAYSRGCTRLGDPSPDMYRRADAADVQSKQRQVDAAESWGSLIRRRSSVPRCSTSLSPGTWPTERVDHLTVDGTRIHARIMGAFEIEGDKIRAWRDHFHLSRQG
jgi:hypothetical protein